MVPCANLVYQNDGLFTCDSQFAHGAEVVQSILRCASKLALSGLQRLTATALFARMVDQFVYF